MTIQLTAETKQSLSELKFPQSVIAQADNNQDVTNARLATVRVGDAVIAQGSKGIAVRALQKALKEYATTAGENGQKAIGDYLQSQPNELQAYLAKDSELKSQFAQNGSTVTPAFLNQLLQRFAVDGDFGRGTTLLTKAVQHALNQSPTQEALKVDGKVGKSTLTSLEATVGTVAYSLELDVVVPTELSKNVAPPPAAKTTPTQEPINNTPQNIAPAPTPAAITAPTTDSVTITAPAVDLKAVAAGNEIWEAAHFTSAPDRTGPNAQLLKEAFQKLPDDVEFVKQVEAQYQQRWRTALKEIPNENDRAREFKRLGVVDIETDALPPMQSGMVHLLEHAKGLETSIESGLNSLPEKSREDALRKLGTDWQRTKINGEPIASFICWKDESFVSPAVKGYLETSHQTYLEERSSKK